MNSLRSMIAASAALLAAACLWCAFTPGVSRAASPAGFVAMQDPPDGEAIYTCPMHPSVRQKGPGRCPICGMDLTPASASRSDGGDDGRAVFHVSREKQRVIGVKVDTAAVREMMTTVRAVGSVGYDERKIAVINLRYSGWIESVGADFSGKFVRRGDTLLTIYSPEAVAAQREHLLSGKYATDTAWTAEGVPGGSGFESATRERLLYLGLDPAQIGRLESSGETPRTLAVLSPVDGTVVEKYATAGMYSEPGTTLYTIADLSTVWLNAEIYQEDVPGVGVGREAVVRFGQHPDREFRGRVSFLLPTLDRATRTTRARIEIPNPDGALKPGMFGSVSIRTGGMRALSVPVSAVMNTGTREIVFVRGDGDEIEARVVRTGRRNDRFCEITAGLRAGEIVIASANFLIDAESRIQGVLDRLRDPEEKDGRQ